MADEKKTAKEKPLMFGTQETDSVQASENVFMAHQEPGYVPGYTEQVRANDLAKARLEPAKKDALYRRWGVKPEPLPARLAWVRVVGLDGQANGNVHVAASQYRRQGYKPCTTADLEKHGWGIPPAAHVEADGSIRREDTALWIVDGARAKQLDEWRKEVNDDFFALSPTTGVSTGVDIDVLEENRDRNFTLP